MLNRKNLFFPSLVAAAIFTVSTAQARYENDIRLGTLLDSAIPEFVYPKDYVGDTSQQPELEEEIRIYFEEGYHPVTVLFYAMRNGMGADEVIDIAEAAGLAREHLEEARSGLEPVLPGGICGTSYFVKDPTSVPGTYSLTSLKEELAAEKDDGSGGGHEEPTLADILSKYFDDGEVISINQDDPNLKQVHDMDWTNTVSQTPGSGVPDNVEEFVSSGIPAHMHATADELLELASLSNDYWFFQDSPLGQGQINSESLSANSPIMIGLYSDNNEAVVSPWQLDRINQAKLDGTRLPVMFFYSSANVRPLSQISKKIGFPELANAYVRNGIKVSSVPSWEEGNYHTQASAQQLIDLFELPAKEDIPEERYTKALSTIDNGRPLQVAFVGGKMYLGDPDRAVAMAEDGGYDFIPINVSYVDLEPDENNFSICENAFPFARSGLGGIGGPSSPGGIVFVPEPVQPPLPVVPCTPTTRVITIPNPSRTRRTITIPCD